MRDFSISERIKILVDVIVSSPLFLCVSIAVILMLMIILESALFGKKISKWIYIFIWLLVAGFSIYYYKKLLLQIIDNLFDTVFMALYFPNLTVYIIVLLISNFAFFCSLFKKNISKLMKIVNIVNSLIINMFFIFIIGVVKEYKINVYEELTVYSNSTLLVLLELSMAVFTSWILISLLNRAYVKLKKYNDIKYPKMQEIVFDESL